MKIQRITLGILKESFEAMAGDHKIGMLIQKFDLPFYFVRLCPIVVTIKRGDILSPAGTEVVKAVLRDSNVAFMINSTYTMWISGIVGIDNVTGCIRTAVVTDHYLERI